MKFSKSLAFKLFVVLFAIITCLTTISFAEEAVTTSLDNEAVVTSEDENSEVTTTDTSSNVVSNDLYLFENSVTIDYPVAGNVYVIAEDVTINNVIDGNVFILANKVTLEANTYVYSDVFICANEVTINGYLYDLYSISNKLTIDTNAYIIRDLKASADTLNLSGFVKRNANIAAETITASEGTALIGGNLSYTATSASIPESIVSGEVEFNEYKVEQSTISAKNYIEDAITVLILALIVVLVVVLATPKFADKEQSILENKFAATLGYGALTLIVIPVVCFILFCTVLGIMPAIAILFAYIFVLQISSAIVSIPLGKIICKKLNKNTKGMNILMSMIAVLVIWALEQIPVLGGILALFVAILGLGILTYAIFHSKVESKNKNVVAEASVVVDAKDSKKADKKEKQDSEKKAEKNNDENK